jgi:ribonucleases P/MRP protein subunit RPP40
MTSLLLDLLVVPQLHWCVLHHITRMLEDSSYVRCLFIDYSRAFDTINHKLLIRKLSSLAMPSKIVRWIVNFLTGRTRAVSLDGKLSNWLPITQSIVQGSCIGTILYIILASDLKLRSTVNLLCKYADDTTLMIPQITDVYLEDEFKHVVQ